MVAELNWDIPDRNVVDMDLWLSPGFSHSLQFLADFAPLARRLKNLVIARF